MTKNNKSKRSKIIEENFDIFDGFCPTCNDDDLEQIDGTMEYQELKCANGHEFVITSKGWSIE